MPSRFGIRYILYAICLYFVFLLGYMLHYSICYNYVRMHMKETVNFTFLSVRDNNFYRILYPAHLQCNAFIEGSEEAFSKYISEGRVVIKQDPRLSMKCSDIRKRIERFSHIDNKDDAQFAIARNVYSEYNFTSGGHFQDFAHYDCIQRLLKKPKWSYVLLLQNNDMVIKTKSEISQILRVMNGAQLVGSQYPWKMKDRFPYEMAPNAKTGKVFKNEYGRSLSQLFSGLSFVHSVNEMFLSREFVSALNRELHMQCLLTIFNKKFYGVDEFLFPSLAFNSHLGLPGQTSKIYYHPDDFGPVRYHIWSTDHNKVECRSEHKRHNICMMTVEYLREMAFRHELIANKIWPSSDFGAVLCMIEILKRRAVLNWPMIGLSRYKSLHQVQEMRLRKLGIFNLTAIKCPWEKEKTVLTV